MKIISANWKMNGTLEDFRNYFRTFLSNNIPNERNIIFGIPYIFLQESVNITKKIPNIEIFSQNVHHEESGSFTGEISVKMISSIGVSGSIVGHSERRSMGETDEIINKKIKLLLNNNLKSIFCIGEKIEDHENIENILKFQISYGLKDITNIENIIFAYEPVWAIGSNNVDIDNIKKASNIISDFCKSKYGCKPKILYGGSVNEKNSKEILLLDNIDGILVGRASLDAKKFFIISGY